MSDEIQEREVARRVFAAEFDDATLSYSESDEERAPNYVVTPTGARVNRLFAVGALTEVEPVNDDVLRGRVADPTGAFVTYAGQYQPDAAAFLERATPPCFVSLTGKGRTYQPEDSDRIFTSVRPESLNEVDADTRDRWVVSAAEATLDRIATIAAALELDARGDDLRAELESCGVDAALASGVALAIDHYRPTEHYLEAVRRLTAQALELVAGGRDAVEALDVDPGESGGDELGPLPDVGVPAVAPDAPATGASRDTETSPPADAAPDPADAPASDEPTAAPGPDDAGTGGLAGETEPGAVTGADDAAGAAAEPAEPVDDASAGIGTDALGGSDATDEDDERAVADVTGGADATGSADGAAPTASATPDGPVDDAGDTPATESAVDDLGDFDAGGGADGDDPGDSGMYELDDEERAELESEFDTEFSTGNEVDDPGEADIDVPDVEDLEAEAAAAAGTDLDAVDAGTDASDDGGATPDPGPDPTPGTDAAGDSDPAETDGREAAVESSIEGTSDDAAPGDIDLEAAAVDVMSDLGDGDGADREAVVAAVVDEHGVEPEAVESAIQEALMGGKCYEPAEDRLKAI